MKRLLLLALLPALVATGCKKEEKAPSKADLLTAKNWSPSIFYMEGNRQEIAPCSLDDYMKFQADKSGYIDPGSVKCSNQDTRTAFTYVPNSDYSTISINYGNYVTTWSVLELNSSMLKLSGTQGGKNLVVEYTGK